MEHQAEKDKGRGKTQRGFTLIELMIAVVVIGILASIAYPSYINYVTQARRSDAMATLLDLQSRQERWRVNNPAYATTLAELATFGALPTSNHYTFAISASTATAYTLQATATGTQASKDAACSPLGVNQLGTRTPDNCWKR